MKLAARRRSRSLLARNELTMLGSNVINVNLIFLNLFLRTDIQLALVCCSISYVVLHFRWNGTASSKVKMSKSHYFALFGLSVKGYDP